MATLVENKDDILTNVRTFNKYREGTVPERKFYRRGLRNCSFFIAEKLDGRYTFTPANFVAYKNTSIANHYSDHHTIQSDTKQAISRVFGPGRENGEIDAEFYAYCMQYGSTKKTPRKEPLRYWVIDDVVAAREGQAGKLSDEVTQTTPNPTDAVGTSLADIDNEMSQSGDEAGIGSSVGLNTKDNDNALQQNISRVVELMKQASTRSGTEKTGVYPERSIPSDCDLSQMVMQRWYEQKGVCALCDKEIPLESPNRLLQMSPDRIDSTNKAYDWQNTRLTHLACNLGKNAATIEEWHGYLAMVRQPPPR